LDKTVKVDRRVLKTKRAIKETFLDLMYEKGFESITIQQIIDGALINRSTFYAHYRDKYDLRDKIENELIDGLADCAKNHAPAARGEDHIDSAAIKTYLDAMLEYLVANRELVSHLLGPDGDPAFSIKIGRRTHEVWSESSLLEHLTLPENYAFAGLSGMVSSILVEWARSGFRDKKETVIEVLFSFLISISKTMIK